MKCTVVTFELRNWLVGVVVVVVAIGVEASVAAGT